MYSNNTNYTFIPKIVPTINKGIITVPLIAQDGTTSGAKTLHITDSSSGTVITGDTDNDVAPNNGWVLRRVIGY